MPTRKTTAPVVVTDPRALELIDLALELKQLNPAEYEKLMAEMRAAAGKNGGAA